MRGVNKVIIVGNLGSDPEVKQFANGGSVTRIAVATSEQWNDKQTGERREQTEWHRISLFNKLGEIAAQYLRKGSQVYIEGSLRTSKYTDQNGVERYATEIRADQMQMLGTAGGAQGGIANNNTAGTTYQNQPQGGYNQVGYNQAPNHFGGYPNQNNAQTNNQAAPQAGQNAGFGNNPFMNGNQAPQGVNTGNNQPAQNPQQNPAMAMPKPGAVDDDIPFIYISNELVGII